MYQQTGDVVKCAVLEIKQVAVSSSNDRDHKVKEMRKVKVSENKEKYGAQLKHCSKRIFKHSEGLYTGNVPK